MTTSAVRRQAAITAIAAVVGGQRAADVETELVDFKLEEGSWDHRVDGPRAIPPREGRVALTLAHEAACMGNNAKKGGILVAGIHDQRGGVGALIGARADRLVRVLVRPRSRLLLSQM